MTKYDIQHFFGAAIRSERLELGISQEELAERAGLHRTYVSDVERGVRNLSLGSIERLAQALAVPVSMLFARMGNGMKAGMLVEMLLVEDSAQDAELALRAFERAKISNVVHVVRDGAEALDFLFATGIYESRASRPLPGIILLDLKLPKIDGLEVLRRIKADKRTQQIPVIILTGSIQDGDISECRRLGCESYIVKPVDFQGLTEVTPNLPLEWALKKPLHRRSQGTSGDEAEGA